MKQIKLNTGAEMPILGLGTWDLRGETCTDSVKKALELGYTHIDTADVYQNHKEIKPSLQGISRERYFLTSKLWITDFGVPHRNVKRFLDELGVQYLDLVLLHWPKQGEPMFEALLEMESMKEVKAVGVSNFTIHHLQDLLDAGFTPAVNQVEFHPYLYQKELLEFCQKHDIVLTAYSPLGRGNLLEDATLISIGKKYDKSSAQIALRWILEKGVVVIPKASSEGHLQENFDIFDFSLSEEDITAIDNLHKNERYVDPGLGEFDY